MATTTTTTTSRLESIRRRITMLRTVLESEDSVINVSFDGVTENWVNRKDLVDELESLERLEERLSGNSSRMRRINISGI